jgi:hypothetical protein
MYFEDGNNEHFCGYLLTAVMTLAYLDLNFYACFSSELELQIIVLCE